jgi:hypothetical protein
MACTRLLVKICMRQQTNTTKREVDHVNQDGNTGKRGNT